MERNYTPVIQKRGRWYVASLEELPGIKIQGKTPADALRNLDATVERMTETNREFAARSQARSVRRKGTRRR
jgi:predicted RNase H-like HicB family nuclease